MDMYHLIYHSYTINVDDIPFFRVPSGYLTVRHGIEGPIEIDDFPS